MSNDRLLKKFNETLDGDHNQENIDTDTQWDYAVKNGKLTFRFEETKSTRDWRDNFRFLRKPYRNMNEKFRVHKGFLKKYKSIRDEIFLALDTFEYEKIEILGFSQGAALAVLAFEDIWYNREEFRDINLVGYVSGCPKVVSWSAPSERWNNLIRIENGNDAVTKVPFKIFGYEHVGVKIHIGEERKWWKLSFKDHKVSSYRKSLE